MHKLIGFLLLVAICVAAPAAASPGNVSTIRALRLENNRAIETHNESLLQRAWAPAIRLLESDGQMFSGAKPLAASYATIEFKDPDFVEYDRRPTNIVISTDGTRAAEIGTWRSVYRTQKRGGSGVYLASWRKLHGDWKIIYEAYVLLGSNRAANDERHQPPKRGHRHEHRVMKFLARLIKFERFGEPAQPQRERIVLIDTHPQQRLARVDAPEPGPRASR